MFVPSKSISNIVSSISPFSPSPLTISFDYSQPLIGTYETIDNDPSVRKRILNYYFDLIRDDWLLDDINDVLNYLKVDNGKVHLIKSMEDYSRQNVKNDTDKTAEEKIEFIEREYLNKYDLAHILGKFVKETGTKWVELPKNEFFVKKLIKEYLIKKLKKDIKRATN